MKTLLSISLFFFANLLFSQNTISVQEFYKIKNAQQGKSENSREISKDSLGKLKAVLIIGGGADGSQNSFAYDNLENKLKEFNIKLTRIYPNTPISQIKQKTKGANILVYVGHGSRKGGLYLNGGNCIRQEDIKDLGLAKNHIVILQNACFSAGSSEDDTSKDIGILEATSRVIDYSKGFIDNGAGLYLATGDYQGANRFLSLFLKGSNPYEIRELLEGSSIVFNKKIKNVNNLEYDLCLTKNEVGYGNYKTSQYGFAYTCLHDFNIYNLIK